MEKKIHIISSSVECSNIIKSRQHSVLLSSIAIAGAEIESPLQKTTTTTNNTYN